jgi:DNA-binding CsgD family transcriptional regulator
MISEFATTSRQADASRLARLLYELLMAGEGLPAALGAVACAAGAASHAMQLVRRPEGEVSESVPAGPPEPTQARAAAGAVLHAGLDALPDGVALLDAEARLVFANAALHAMAAEADGLTLGPRGLETPDPATGLALRRAAIAALAAAEGRVGLLPAAGCLAVNRRAGGAPWMVRALPVVPRHGARAPDGFRGAMLLVSDAGRRPQPAPALLARLFGLTPAEASLAASLAAGRTIDDHAKRRGIARETVRSQLATMRRKTGCRRQTDLVAMLARIPG